MSICGEKNPQIATWELLLVTSEAPQIHRGGAQPNPAARCPRSPESPPTSSQGSGEQEPQHHTSWAEARGSLQEAVGALQEDMKQQSVMDTFISPKEI